VHVEILERNRTGNLIEESRLNGNDDDVADVKKRKQKKLRLELQFQFHSSSLQILGWILVSLHFVCKMCVVW